MDFDVQWRLRRLRFVMRKSDDMACFDDRGAQIVQFAMAGKELDFEYPKYLAAKVSGNEAETADSEEEARRGARAELRKVLRAVKSRLNKTYQLLSLRRQKM